MTRRQIQIRGRQVAGLGYISGRHAIGEHSQSKYGLKATRLIIHNVYFQESFTINQHYQNIIFSFNVLIFF